MNTMIISQIQRSDLYRCLQQLASSQYQGIPGVTLIDSGKPGPSLGIMVMTHGNEPAGLAAVYNLLQDQRLKDKLGVGRVFLILNNLSAAERYFEQAQDLSFTADFRFIDQDMNRVPNLPWPDTSETRRMKQLLPIYQELTHVLDLHSTSAASPPMLIEINPDTEPLFCTGVNILISNIVPHLNGPPLVSLCQQAQGFVLETGSHESPDSRQIAQEAVWRMLIQLKMVSVDTLPVLALQKLEIYHIYQAVIFPDTSYQLLRLLESFEFLPSQTIFAQGAHETLTTQQDSYVIMPPPRLKPHHPGSEFLYLATKEISE